MDSDKISTGPLMAPSLSGKLISLIITFCVMIIIVGLGKVGYAIAQQMVGEEHDLILVDESAAVIEHADATLDAMCVEGKLLSSEALARQLAGYAAGGTSKVCFLVGGSFGLDEGLKREASLRLSMSPMTFQHHLARVMLAEQIYRACTINAGTQYHK